MDKYNEYDMDKDHDIIARIVVDGQILLLKYSLLMII